ncbi:1502_t:CDS:2, partial [Paraglomus occultum]
KLRDQNSSLDSTSSEPSYENQDLELSIRSQSISNSSELSSDNNSSCDSNSKSPTNVSPNQRHETLCSAKIPYNQKVERGLRLELSICTKDNNHKISKVFDIFEEKSSAPQIPEFSLEAILSGSSSVTSQNIVDLFRTTDMSCQAQSGISSEIKVISVTNCHAHMSDLSSSNDSSAELARSKLPEIE